METDFSALALPESLLSVVKELGFSTLTPIQAQTIPLMLAGEDVIGQSNTGSGKTAAFALSILSRLDLERRELQGMVLCPTRELSAQVAREFRKLGRRLPGLTVLELTGGIPARAQRDALARGVHVVVGTPGRVMDHLRQRSLRVHGVGAVVLDEADRMLGMGFRDDIESILVALPKVRQTAFFSATFPESIEALSEIYQQNPARLQVEQEALPASIRQLVYTVEEDQKLDALRAVLGQHPHESALVFVNFKASAAEIERVLQAEQVSVASLHGDLVQLDRDRVMARFRNGSVRVLIATDVAARGIDLLDLDLVVNYELPQHPEVYVHRVGRTGRAGRAGLAVSLASSSEQPRLDAIEAAAELTLERGTLKLTCAATSRPRAAAMVTLRIDGGRKVNLRPGDILGALTGEAGGLRSEDVGKIEIHDNFAYVAVSGSVSRQAMESMNAGRIKGRKFRTTLVQ